MAVNFISQSAREKELLKRLHMMADYKIRNMYDQSRMFTDYQLRDMYSNKKAEMDEARRIARNTRGLAALKDSGALRDLNVTDIEALANMPDDILAQLLRPKTASAVTQNFGAGTAQDYAQQAASYLSGGQSDVGSEDMQQFMPQDQMQQQQAQQNQSQIQESDMRDVLANLQKQTQFNPIMDQMFNPKQQLNIPQQIPVQPQQVQESAAIPEQQLEPIRPMGTKVGKKPKLTEQQVANKLSEYARVKYGAFKPKSVKDVSMIEQDLIDKKNQLLGLPTKEEREHYEKEYKPLNDAIDKKFNALNEMAPKAGKMLELLREGNVASGVSGKYLPTWYLGKDSEDFAGASDDIAAGLTALQTGVQSIGKIKFNQQRKPNLGQSFEGQLARTYSLLEDITRGYLEHDLSQYLLQENQGVYKDYKTDLKSYYNRLSTKVPTPTSDDQEGDEVIGKDGSLWVLEGPVYRFKGFKKGK